MNVHVEPKAKDFLIKKHHNIVTIRAEQECVGSNCSEFFLPIIQYKEPELSAKELFDRFDIDELTVYFEKRIEPDHDVTLKLERKLWMNTISVDGLNTTPTVTHNKL